MSMLRKGDRVLTPILGLVCFVRERARPGLVRITLDDDASARIHLAPDDALTLLCHEVDCVEPASCFTKSGAQPVCDGHAYGYDDGKLVDVRPDPSTICPCACGEDLAAGTSRGIWTMEGIACEYRDCAHCGSTRAFMAPDVVEGHAVVYANVGQWASFLDALEYTPAEGAELQRGGVTIARAIDGPKRTRRMWLVLPPTMR